MKKITAAELLEKLSKDPAYQAKKAQRENESIEWISKANEIEKPIIKELLENGFNIQSLDDLMRTREPLPDSVVKILANWLPKLEDRYNIREIIIRGFTGQKLDIDYRILADIYDNKNTSDDFRFAISNCIANSSIDKVEDWLRSKVEQGDHTLLLAASRYLNREFVLPYLLKSLDKKDDFIYQALTEIGGQSEVAFLVQQVGKYKGYEKKQVEKIIKGIKKRLNKEQAKH
ncbi:MAG: hypothetical protein ACK5PF_01445 [bacterium]|jgi:hypothetical protein